MKPIALVSLLLSFLLPQNAGAAARDVLAHASSDRAWVARVNTIVTPDGPADQTTIYVRQSGPGQVWGKLITIPARASELAARSSTLAVLLANGTWMSVWAPDGAATGSPLPAGGRIRALGDDGENLWAVGTVNGGLAAAQRAIATQPATDQSAPAAATNPSLDSAIGGTTSAGAVASGPTVLEPKPVLFQQRAGAWAPVAEFPSSYSLDTSAGDVSIAIVAGRPLVSFELTNEANSHIFTIRLLEDGTWDKDVSSVYTDANEKIADFDLIAAGQNPVLWATGGKSAGRIYPGASMVRPPIDLKWPADHPLDSIPAVTFSGGYLRIIGLSKDKLYEQRYEPGGKPVEGIAELAAPTDLNMTLLEYWFNSALCFALAFSVGATLFRRAALRKSGVELHPPPPAPFLPRLGAGILDLLPVLLSTTYIVVHTDDSRNPWDSLQQLPALIANGTGIAIYLVHTTLTELFTGRSAGKWVFGLKVITLTNEKPNAMQMLVRNLLRVLDLLWFPLILVLISPLRQRSADIAAGTMVILEDAKPGDDARDAADLSD